MFFEVFEGNFPDITRYEIDGTLEHIGTFTISINVLHDHVLVQVSRQGRRNLRVRLAHEEFRHIALNHLVVASRSRSPDDPSMLIRIPYGPAHEECFVNGEEVFNSLTMTVNESQVLHVTALLFDNCVPGYRTLEFTTAHDEVVVTLPSP